MKNLLTLFALLFSAHVFALTPAQVSQAYTNMLGTAPADTSFSGFQYWVNQPTATVRDMYYAGMLRTKGLLDGSILPAPPLPERCATQNRVVPLDFMADRGQNFRTIIDTGQSVSFRVTTGPGGQVGSFALDIDTIGQNVDEFVNVSKSPCDFGSYAQLDNKVNWGAFQAANGCAQTSSTISLKYAVAYPGTPIAFPNCRLDPNSTYYINIRNESADPRDKSLRGIDSCPPFGNRLAINQHCGFVFQFH